jgi:histidinol-phosphate aminotransferase
VTDWSRIVTPELAGLDQFALGQTIAEVKEHYGLDEVLKLSWNENLFGPLPGVFEAIHAELDDMWLYPEAPNSDFREEVAALTATSPAHVVPAHGSLALIGIVASAFLRPGDHVVVPELTYGLYAQISATRGASVERVPVREADLTLDLATLARRAQEVDARIVWICDPNNPTGRALGADEWTAFLDALPDRCVAVVDEAYGDFVPPERRVRRERDVVAGRKVVVLRSFSKLYGLAGLRIGYALADPSLVPYFDIVEEPFNVNCAALAAACACLRATDAVAARRREVASARTTLSELLADAGFEPMPSEANFVLARLDLDDLELAGALAQRGILIRAGSDYGLARHARVTVAPEPLLERFGAALADACASLRTTV